MNNDVSKPTNIVSKCYLHLFNGGITFSVEDSEFGPFIEIFTSSFGNLNHSIKTYTDKESLKAISDVFLKAAEHEYRVEPYVHKVSINK